MKVRQTLICFFFLTLRDGNTGLINAEILDHTGTEGGNITVGCSFYFSGGKKLFCKDECKEKDILIETTADRDQSGRYSIEYKEGTFPVSSTVLYVSITNLTKSDSGWYRCRLERSLLSNGNEEFEIRVEDAPITSKPNWTLRPFPTSVPSVSTLTTTQSLSSSSGSSTPSSASPEDTAAGQSSGVVYVRWILVVMFIVLSAAVLIFCRKRASKPKETPVENANVAEANQVYEEIREENRQGRSPVEISIIYTCAKYTKPNGVETTDDYSFATAASSQNKIEDDSSKLAYSQVAASSDGIHAEDASPPLYSTVTSHQL